MKNQTSCKNFVKSYTLSWMTIQTSSALLCSLTWTYVNFLTSGILKILFKIMWIFSQFCNCHSDYIHVFMPNNLLCVWFALEWKKKFQLNVTHAFSNGNIDVNNWQFKNSYHSHLNKHWMLKYSLISCWCYWKIWTWK